MGENGAGKTTLIKLLSGLYAVSYTHLDVYKRQEDNGFVHQITNIDGAKKRNLP